jgi:phenylacetate-CoA ligase
MPIPQNYYQSYSEKLQEILSHLFSTPFYQQKLSEVNIHARQITDLSAIKSLPFTFKEDLRNTTPYERSPFGIESLEFIFSSSGTSGQPTLYYWTTNDTEVLREAGKKAMNRVGIHPQDVALLLAPMGMPIMWYCMFQQFNVMQAGIIPVGVRPPVELLSYLKDHPVSVIVGLPILATRLFEFAQLQGIELPLSDMPLRQFQFGGEFLSNSRRKRVEEMWQVEAFNFYGISEIFGPIAGECKVKQGLHLLDEYVYMEVLDPETKEPVEDGTPGVAVFTTLWKKGAPLLRYWSDDFVSYHPEPCPCGEHSPRIRYLGRPIDMWSNNGHKVFASELEDVLLSFPVGNEYQLIIHEQSAELLVEEIPDLPDLPVRLIEEQVGSLLHYHVKLKRLSPGSLPRDQVKPKRILID